MTQTRKNRDATEGLIQLCRNSNIQESTCSAADVKQYVEQGADFLIQWPGSFKPILHHFIAEGLVDCLKVCLDTTDSIDFSVANNKWEKTAFHWISENNSDAVAAEILTLLLQRLEAHPLDTVDWSYTDINDDSFISNVARYQKLSSLWPVMKQFPFFIASATPESFNVQLAWKHDLEAIKEDHNFTARAILDASVPTRNLIRLCRTSDIDSFNHEEVLEEVRNGGDILFYDPDMPRPILHHFIFHGHVESVEACLQTEAVIDFTKGDEWGWTPMMFTCPKRTTEETSVRILELLLYRIETHPLDVVAWGMLTLDGYDFLSAAAKYQKLSALWPIVCQLPYFSDALVPFPLLKGVWRFDWEALDAEQERFTIVGDIIEAERVTASMVRQCELAEWRPEASIVHHWVERGANISFTDPDMNKSILHHFFVIGAVECVAACLATTHAIDFSLSAEYGWTPLHYLCVHKEPGVGLKLLQLILDRLARNPLDTINWGIVDDDGNDFISYAAYYHKLSLFWPLVQHLHYFRDEQKPIRISLPVPQQDFDALGEERRNFNLEKGFSLK